MIARLFILLAVVAMFFSCGSNVFGYVSAKECVREISYPFAVHEERQAVFPHLHYSVDMHTLDRENSLVELSFFFLKEQGDSLLWVECVESVPVALIDTAGHKMWAYHAL